MLLFTQIVKTHVAKNETQAKQSRCIIYLCLLKIYIYITSERLATLMFF